MMPGISQRFMLAALAACCAASTGAAEPFKPAAYYFARKETCTVMVDFEKTRDKVRSLAPDARALELVRSMLAEWSGNASAKCNGTSKVALLAVYIPGVDVYGRPDFSNRTNLMKLEGEAAKLQALARSGGITMDQVRKNASVEIF